MAEGKAVQKFKEKLEALEKDTRLTFELLPELIADHVDTNRLYAGWFAPGTILGVATNGKSSINYETVGGVDATLLSPTGASVHTFLGKFNVFENEEIKISDDNDIKALADGTHASGYTLSFNNDNRVKVSVEKLDIDPIIAEDPSVARVILNGDIAKELKASIDELIDPKDRLPDADINARLDALADAAEELGGFEDMPDPPSEPEEDDSEGFPISEDIPHYSETEEGKKAASKLEEEMEEDEDEEALPEPVEKEVKKTEKKTAKKAAAKEPKKTAKKAKDKESPAPADEEAVGRFDLLPLDIIGKIVSEEFDTTGEKDVLGYIEDYKKSKDEEALIKAAMYLIDGYFASPTDFVMALAVMIEKEAEEYGEDFWKEKGATRCINEAIKDWLMYLKEGNEDNKLMRAVWSLICAAKAEKKL